MLQIIWYFRLHSFELMRFDNNTVITSSLAFKSNVISAPTSFCMTIIQGNNFCITVFHQLFIM